MPSDSPPIDPRVREICEAWDQRPRPMPGPIAAAVTAEAEYRFWLYWRTAPHRHVIPGAVGWDIYKAGLADAPEIMALCTQAEPEEPTG
jgi:hypothetical protein